MGLLFVCILNECLNEVLVETAKVWEMMVLIKK